MIIINALDGNVTVNLAAGLERFRTNGQQVFSEIGTSLHLSILQGFEAERSPEGVPWEPLKPSTVRRRKGKDAHPILRQSGDLYSGINPRPGPDSVFIGVDTGMVPYAAAHQFGVEIRRKAGAVKLHFRRVTSGKHKGRMLFSKSGNADYGMAAAAHVIRIPARRYLFQRDGGIPDSWKQAVIKIVTRHLEP